MSTKKIKKPATEAPKDDPPAFEDGELLDTVQKMAGQIDGLAMEINVPIPQNITPGMVDALKNQKAQIQAQMANLHGLLQGTIITARRAAIITYAEFVELRGIASIAGQSKQNQPDLPMMNPEEARDDAVVATDAEAGAGANGETPARA